ncbi:MAG: peptidylprolyl isomerase, partial [Clostridia bacterium]|nr:peptidylprolyl isomerase [Clostridia bacterium]
QFFINQATAKTFAGRASYQTNTKTLLDNFDQYVTQYRARYDQLIAQYGQALVTQAYPSFETFFWSAYQLAPNANVVPDEVWDLYEQNGGNIHLDGAFRPKGGHTVFGQVFEGMDVVDAIAAKETDANNKPLQDVTIVKAEVVAYQPS